MSAVPSVWAVSVDRFVCIHGHFYQPPRENPWLEEVEVEDSAHPYHDWNERITAECYAPNSASRILDERGRILRIVNNYSRISFNFGPTLLSWLERKRPETYRAVLDADQESLSLFSGHGSALAQPYGHMIMPLASARDKRTQVAWGLRDFESRFGRKPEGMWLPETAVDLATLEELARAGILFTVLAPHQARRWRPQGETSWAGPSGIDPSRPYRVALPSGASIAVFFYDGPMARAVAFEGLLSNGEEFARRLCGAFSSGAPGPQLVHIATDGETYGHHHRFGDMALAYALHHLETRCGVRLTNYGQYLAAHPPEWEAEIVEETAWSCAHGIERWRSDCGCQTGARPGWNQAWRTPLRAAFDWLRDRLEPLYEKEAAGLLQDPWTARDAYIRVLLDRSPQSVQRFLGENSVRPLSPQETIRALELLELQRHCMQMYTSCGWFFNDPSGIETVQVLRYAARAVQLAERLFGRGLEGEFLKRLQKAKSNLPELGSARRLYETQAEPASMTLADICAHHAILSLFEDAPSPPAACYDLEREEHLRLESGKARLALGRLRVRSRVTGESASFGFGALHLGDHNAAAGVRSFQDERSFLAARERLRTAFERADLAASLSVLQRDFGQGYSLASLFKDEQRKVLRRILESAEAEAGEVYRGLYERQAPLLRFLKELGIPAPGLLLTAAEASLTGALRREFERPGTDLGRISGLLQEAAKAGLRLRPEDLSFPAKGLLDRLTETFRSAPEDEEALRSLVEGVRLIRSLPFETDLWSAQNLCYALALGGRLTDGPAPKDRPEPGGGLKELAELLLIRL